MSLVQGGTAEPYRLLAEVFHDVLSEDNLDTLLDRIADTLAVLIPYEDVHIYQANEAKRELIPVLARSKWAHEVMSETFSFGEGITGWAAEHQEPVLANQAHLDPRVRFVPGTPPEPEALIAVPLVARGRLKGTLNIYRVGEDARFTDEELHLATRFGDAAALALDNAHIRARLEHQASTDGLTGLCNHRSFQELLRAEVVRASTERGTVALVMLDIDEFKRVNDVYGHGIGDELLVRVADVLRRSVRAEDVACRIGGEEFAIILPSGDLESSIALAERLGAEIGALEAEAAGRITISTGVAVGPEHAANPRDLVSCAEAAMMAAKARGRGKIVVYDNEGLERPSVDRIRRDDVRPVAHLKMLQRLSGKLSRLNDVPRIGLTIADELRRLIDYHNCRVFLREGDDLVPIAFRGDLLASRTEPVELLRTRVGRGITGRVAQTGESLVVPDAANCEFGMRITGTPVIDESLLAVPLEFGSRVIGVIVISKLGLDQFDANDLRVVEVLAGHASVALENARLYEAQKREAESATALLEFGRDLAAAEGLADVAGRVVRGVTRMLGCSHASVWLQEAASRDLVMLAGIPEDASAWSGVASIPEELLRPWLGRHAPYLVTADEYRAIADPPEGSGGDFAIAPFIVDGRWGVIAASITPEGFDAKALERLGGLGQQTKLALGIAASYETLERTFLATVEALANALEASDEGTSRHAREITDLALEVGLALGLDQRALKTLQLGALFHDIGKIGVPAAILSKPGPLTDEERKLMQTHPLLGERILAPIEQLQEVRRIVRSTHEHFDGSGYPDELAGAEIPIEARIVLACDAYNAMTSDRPYRDALDPEEAKRRLAAAAGSQFDPHVVEVLLRVLAEPR